jgi:phage virion morphogenesis protein
MIRIRLNQQSSLALTQQLELLQLTPGKRRQVLAKIGREIIKETRQSIREQRSPDGTAWEARKQGKRRMLRKMARGLAAKTTTEQTTVGWRNGLTSAIAYKHQHGVTETYTARQARREREKTDPDAPATRNQARLLRQLGYSIPAGKKGNRQRTPGISWIMANMTAGQAGLVLHRLITEKRDGAASKTSWQIMTAARPFLGIKQERVIEIISTELQRMRG